MAHITRSAALALATAAALAPRIARAQASTIRIGASAAATNAEAYYADQLGMFKQVGVTTTQTVVTRSSETLPAIIRGDLDIGCTAPQGIANAIIHGFPIQAIAAAAVFAGNPPPSGLFVANNSPLHDDPRPYQTATIAVQTLDDSQSLGVLMWLQKNHLDPSKVKFIEMPFSTMAAALARGVVQAAVIVEPFGSANKDTIRTIPHVYDSLGVRWAMVAWYARHDWVEKNRPLLKAFTDAIYATARRVNADPSSIDTLLAAYSKQTIETVRTTPHPVFGESMERSAFEIQLQGAATFKLIPRFVSYHEMTGL